MKLLQLAPSEAITLFHRSIRWTDEHQRSFDEWQERIFEPVMLDDILLANAEDSDRPRVIKSSHPDLFRCPECGFPTTIEALFLTSLGTYLRMLLRMLTCGHTFAAHPPPPERHGKLGKTA